MGGTKKDRIRRLLSLFVFALATILCVIVFAVNNDILFQDSLPSSAGKTSDLVMFPPTWSEFLAQLDENEGIHIVRQYTKGDRIVALVSHCDDAMCKQTASLSLKVDSFDRVSEVIIDIVFPNYSDLASLPPIDDAINNRLKAEFSTLNTWASALFELALNHLDIRSSVSYPEGRLLNTNMQNALMNKTESVFTCGNFAIYTFLVSCDDSYFTWQIALTLKP